VSVRRVTVPLDVLRVVLRDIRIEHTLFALPFAYVGMVFGAGGWATWWQFAWITLAVLGARTAAMAANRYVDRDIDAANPRTARRSLPSGTLAPELMLATAVVGLVVFVIAAGALRPLCLALTPVAALGAFIYPYCKRFTWGTHLVLGAVDGLAPLGAYIAITGTVTLPAALLFLAVTFWVAGFDVPYALMDYDVDVATGVHSIPARFGKVTARPLLLGAHALMVVLLALAGAGSHAGAIYWAGIACAVALVVAEDRIFATSDDVFALNDRIFNANMFFSIAFLVITIAAFVRR
jgi:4-hydroxybenzoate polyprenyltransferase